MLKTISVESRSRCEFIDITQEIRKIIKTEGVKNGICYIYIPHTTAGVTINEGADPDVRRDIIKALEKIAPNYGDYSHSEGNSDAHIKATLTGSSATILIEEGAPILGVWQSIFFCEYDGPRKRKAMVKIIGL